QQNTLKERRLRCETQNYRSRCLRLGKAINDLRIPAAELEWVEHQSGLLGSIDNRALLERIVAGTPLVDDLMIRRHGLVCEKYVRAYLVRSLARACNVWSAVESVDEEMKLALAQEGVSSESKGALRRRTEMVSSRGTSELALRLCDLAQFLGTGRISS